MNREIKTPTLYCPTHPAELLHRLKYQVSNGKLTKSGNRGTEWIMTDWFICASCAVPVKVKMTVDIIAKA